MSERDIPYRGPKRELDPRIEQLIVAPESLGSAERDTLLREARREASFDALQNSVVVKGPDGDRYWGAEYPNVFTFVGEVGGKFDRVPKDPDKWTTAMQLAVDKGGSHTHVVFDMEDGQSVMIEKTSGDIQSAAHQTFALSSTKAAERGLGTKPVDTQMLAGVVAMPGHPLRLGEKQTASPVDRITTLRLHETGRVAAGHPGLDDPTRQRDPLGSFTAKINKAKGIQK